MAIIEIKVPDIGDFTDVAVIELLVKPGDSIAAEQSLITVESDKASMEIPSSHAGVVKELKVALGDKVQAGSLVLLLEVADAASGAEKAVSDPEYASNQPVALVQPWVVAIKDVAIEVSPVTPDGAATAGTVEVRVPDMGDFKDVAVIEVMVQVGDSVRLEQSLITVESDKASMEIPSSAAGVIKQLKVKLGDKVNAGDLLAILESRTVSAAVAQVAPAVVPAATSAAPVAPAAPVQACASVATSPSVAPAPAPMPMPAPELATDPHLLGASTLGLPHASPSVRKFARELGVPLAEVQGSGLKGRITDRDVQAFTRSVMAGATQTIAAKAHIKPTTAPSGNENGGLGLIPWPKVDFAKFGPVQRVEQSRIRKIGAANLLRNAILIPAVTNHDDADITDLEAFRVAINQEVEKSGKPGVKVTMLAFLVKACVAALKKYPEFNSSLDADSDNAALIYKQYYHIGFAADTPSGLMVPVIKDADRKGILQISQEMGELAKKARDGKLSPTEMSGASFTISSLGGIGGRYFTPIINAPEVSILGVCRSTIQPVWDGKAFQPRLMLPLSLTWDHRVIDGAAAARFNVYLGQILGDFRRVLL